jgi:hypothetical protein
VYSGSSHHSTASSSSPHHYAAELYGLRKVFRAPAISIAAAGRSLNACVRCQGPQERRAPLRDFWAIRGSWLGIEEGQLFCLLGPNGAGKTTTINCLTGGSRGLVVETGPCNAAAAAGMCANCRCYCCSRVLSLQVSHWCYMLLGLSQLVSASWRRSAESGMFFESLQVCYHTAGVKCHYYTIKPSFHLLHLLQVCCRTAGVTGWSTASPSAVWVHPLAMS